MRICTLKKVAWIVSVVVVGLVTVPAWAGPKDTTTPYPVQIKIGDTAIKTVLGQGVTTISHDDAKALGLLDADGDPTAGYPPDSETYLGNPKVKMHKYKKLRVKVKAVDKDGNPTGDEIEVELSDVLVPVKPDNQYGDTDAEKLRRSQKYGTKISSGSVPNTDGKKLVKKDEATDDPKKNNRSTKWEEINPPAPKKVATDPASDPDPDDALLPRNVRGVMVNGVFVEARHTDLPYSVIPEVLADALGVVRTGELLTLTPLEQANLSSEGLIDGPETGAEPPLTCEIGEAMVTLTTVDGEQITTPVALLVYRPAFFDVFYMACGSNIHALEGHTSWYDSVTAEIVITPTPCPADFNQDGFLTGDDFDQYVAAFEEGSSAADFNLDGFVTGDDFDAFVLAFEAGCP